MISQLTGKPLAHTSGIIILQVRGVGYKVFLPPSLALKLLKQPKATLFIHTYVRDDTLALYGFQSLAELQLFEVIISISGIGPKIAIALMDKGVEAINSAITKADVDFFTSIPRLGKKNAQKIIIELKPKLGDLQDLDLAGESPQTQEAITALTSLGFTKRESRQALKQISHPDDTLETKITQAIRYLGKRRL
jgi:Holliday junction DNA helicase RuvA